jgi:outer membrane protein assembly factor BamB
MSDFLTDLRNDLVDAHARYGQRSAIERAARAHHPSRARLAAVAASAAAVTAGVVGGVALTRGTDDQVIGRRAPGVVARVALGGSATGLSLGGVASESGAAWIVVNVGDVMRVDATTNRVTARIPVAGPGSRLSQASDSIASGLAAGDGAVWATVFRLNPPHANETTLIRIDPKTNRVTRIPLAARASSYVSPGGSSIPPLGFGGGSLWVLGPQGGARFDPRTGAVADLVSWGLGDIYATDYGIAGDDLWVHAADGQLVEFDARTGARTATVAGRPAHTVRLAVIPGAGVIVGEDDGTLRRIDAASGRALWTTRLGDIVGPIAVAGDRLWAVNQAGRFERLTAISLATGRELSSLRLQPTLGTPQLEYPLAYIDGRVWVASPPGHAVIVRP